MRAANAMSAAASLRVIVVCKNPGAPLPVALASIWEHLHALTYRVVRDGTLLIARFAPDPRSPCR